MKMEKRIGEIRSIDGRKLIGHAARFNTPAKIGSFEEVILPGAFRSSLESGQDVVALVDHDRGKLLARMKSGTLRLREDDQGLAYEIDLPETSLGNDLLEMARRSDLGGMSFGFIPEQGGESWEGRSRKLSAVRLYEVSVVQWLPAYQGTSINVRSGSPRLRKALMYMETL
jgi:uncharacterized protein